jgi:predicted MFS family arabinose efflux permease
MFYGWRVVIGAFSAQLLVVGFFTYSVSLLVEPVRGTFGVDLESVMYSLTIATLFGLFLTPVAGILIDRYPVRLLMTGGMVLTAGGLAWLARSQSITEYNLVFGATMALANGFAASMAASAVISRWFTASRGKALGISAIGTSVGGMVIPALMTWWIAEYGWRTALDLLALGALLIILPLVWLTVRGRPEDVGMAPEGSHDGHSQAPLGPVLSMGRIIREPAYWLIGMSLGLLFCVYTSILANISPYATGLGESEARASSLILVIAIAGLTGKLLFGMAADRFNLKVGLWAAHLLVAVGFLILATEPPYAGMLLAATCLGLAAGGQLPVWGAMLAKVFGVLSYGRAMGAMGPLITLLVMPGFPIVGRLYESSGGYSLVLWVFTAVIAVAAALLLPLRLDPVTE